MIALASLPGSEGDAAGSTYWNDAWKKLGPPQRYTDPPFEAHDVLKNFLPHSQQIRSIEVGCVPGNWLVYLNKEFGYQVSGVDYSDSLSYVKDNLEFNGIGGYELFSEDFFKFEPKQPYDVVLSSGFVEHFDDYAQVVRKHIEIAKPGGLIVIIVPNLTHIHRVLCGFFQPAILAVHRFPLMRRTVLADTLSRSGADVLFCDYIRTFRPTYPLPWGVDIIRRITQKTLALTKLDGYGNRFGSPYLVSVARRHAGDGQKTSELR